MSTALALLSQGAGGNTYEQLKQALHLGNDKSAVANQYFKCHEALEKNAGAATLSIANRIYVQEGNSLSKAFQEVATSKFKSGIESLNFVDAKRSADTINHSLKRKQMGKSRNCSNQISLNRTLNQFW